MNITSVKEYIRNTFLALLGALVTLLLVYAIPYKIISTENHTVIGQIEKLRFIGPILIVIGIIGCLSCLWNFFFDAKGSAFHGDQKHLMVKGLFRYVRNPMCISGYLIVLGQALSFQSLDLLVYLSFCIIWFQIEVIYIEEPSLKKRFGESYEQYCKSVRRWIPRLTPYRENGSRAQ